MVNERTPIQNEFNENGYLINHSEYYLFQPKTTNDRNLPLFCRMRPVKKEHPKYVDIKDLFSIKDILKKK